MAMQPDELKALRQGAGLTQAEMGDAVGLSGTLVGLMERGKAPIEKRTSLAARKIVDKFFVSAATAVGGWAVARRTVSTNGPRLNGLTALYGHFSRRDHAYRWAAALLSARQPRATRRVERDRASDVARYSRLQPK